MHASRLALPLALSLAALAPAAQAQSVTCESRNGQFNECRLPFAEPPVLQQVLSSAACVEGQSWGSRWPGSVWVANGCRARFGRGGSQPYRDGQLEPLDRLRAENGGDSFNPNQRYHHDDRAVAPAIGGSYVLRCESEKGRQRQCRAPVGGHLVLLRQLSQSPCIENQTWGNNGNGTVWVSHGCRGEFGPAAQGYGGYGGGYGGHTSPRWVQSGSGGAITCSSEGGGYSQCGWDPRQGRPRLLEQLSGTECREGRNWGYDRQGFIWVDRGCRGRFGLR